MADAIESVSAEPARDEGTRGRIRLFQIQGIKVTLDYSWLVIFALVIWSLSSGYFPRVYPDASLQIYWLAGFVATILFFASILFHELSHSLTAVRAGIEIPEVTLFIFGGVAHLSEDPQEAKTELKIALAGPLASVFLAIMFGLIHRLLSGLAPPLVSAVFEYLAWINIALAVFNLVPGYPLDGGRVLRGILWWRGWSLTRATKIASDMGKGFAWALMILGGLQIFSGALIGGLWLIFIGMFLRGIAASGYREVLMKHSLEGATVRDIMEHDVVSVPPDLSVEEAIHSYFLRHGYGGFPVVRNESPIGLLCLAQVKDTTPEDRETKTAQDIMMPLDESLQIAPDASLADAFGRMSQSGTGRLLVMKGGEFMGMITKNGLLRFLEFKQVLRP